MESGREPGCAAASRLMVGSLSGISVMPEHKYKIGQRLFLVRAVNTPEGSYVVIKRLPKRGREFEYQIKNITEPYERVACESQLKTTPWRNAPGRSFG